MSESGASSRSLAILHVDDDALSRRVVRDILQAFGHRAVDAASGAEALARLERQAFDVLLLDIHLPGIDGLEMLRRLRQGAGPNRDAAAIALTAEPFGRGRAPQPPPGFDDIVAKPILVAQLRAALDRAAVRRTPSRTGRRRAGG